MTDELKAEREAESRKCPHKSFSGTCMCGPKCAICGFGEHMAVHMPAFDKNGNKVRDHFDHAYTPKLTRSQKKAMSSQRVAK